MKRTLTAVSTSFVCLLFSIVAFGQGGVATGDLHITVKDPKGDVVNNATVAVRDVAKGVERAVLITDAVMPAGCEPGPYKLGEVDVVLHPDGSVRLAGGTRLAGSALKLNKAIGNVMCLAGLTLREAITLATRNPARVARIPSRQRGLNPGERGDLVSFRYDKHTKEIEVLETYLLGQRVF